MQKFTLNIFTYYYYAVLCPVRPGQTNINHRQMQTLIQYFQSFLHKQSVYSSIYDPLSTNFIYLFKATARCRQNVCSQFPAPDFIMRFTARWLLGITITRVSRYLSRTVRGDVTLRVARNRNNGPGITPFITTLRGKTEMLPIPAPAHRRYIHLPSPNHPSG